jgi:hypothetical protein
VGNRAIGWLQKFDVQLSDDNPLVQIQCSILRRLQSYWCPRFIIHSNRMMLNKDIQYELLRSLNCLDELQELFISGLDEELN